MESFARKDFGPRERRAILKALDLLDKDEQHPSLRVTFYRRAGGRKELIECSRHYE